MKQKLTLTVERAAVQAARRAARRQGTSISALFEKSFVTSAKHKPAFAERWLNKHPPTQLPVASDFPHDHRFAHLLAKYVKPAPHARAD
ncbi:MAG: DUF6364 family protein [Opitutaceae bacterium]|nr:DUF6364 family protein [Opitutaceae bacterium]